MKQIHKEKPDLSLLISPQYIPTPLSRDEFYSFDYWFARHQYYHTHIANFYKSLIPPAKKVFHVHCKNGYILEEVAPPAAAGVEPDKIALSLARKRYGAYRFYSTIAEVPPQSFDYIVLSFATMETDDIHAMLSALHRFCHKDTRIIIESYQWLWAPVLWSTQFLGVRRPTKFKSWVSVRDLAHFITVAGFEPITQGRYMLAPKRVPFVSWFLNYIVAHLPLINRLCLHQWVMVRPRWYAVFEATQPPHATVSIIIPCRNEKGNIEAAITRTPTMGSHTEFIFVEGHSRDGTWEEINRVKQAYPHLDIKCYQQTGRGKGDAVRTGFAYAHGDILMILDADLTTPPEELPKFYTALVNQVGDMVNGSRLVYGMESGAMGFLSWCANRGFGWIVSWIIGQPITDTLCGTKALWRKEYQALAVQRLQLGIWDPFGDFDLIFGAAKRNLKIVDIPVHYKRRMYGTTNITRFKEVWFLIWMCLRAWWILRVRP
jgi:hypothetical protein